MNDEWQLLLSARVMVFVLDQPLRTRRRLLDLLESLRLHPVPRDDDLPRYDSRGRLNHLRFVDDFANPSATLTESHSPPDCDALAPRPWSDSNHGVHRAY